MRAGVRAFPNWQGGHAFLPALWCYFHPSYALIAVGNRTDPPFVFEQAQISRQRCSLKTEFRRQLGDGERAGLRERGQNGELGCTKPAPSKMSLVMLGHGPAGVAQGRARTSATRLERG